MTKPQLMIDECMAPSPYTIEHTACLAKALAEMTSHQIRHLPVMRDEAVIGVISQRDITVANCVDGCDMDSVAVSEVMTDDLYSVEIGTNVKEVALNMYARKIGSAVVTDGGKLVGVFTTVDALHALATLL
jgi:acetoin utilization protein AcuB